MLNDEQNLNMTPNKTVPPVVHVSQYDNKSRSVTFLLIDGGLPYTIPTGSVVTVQGTKKDKTGFQYECNVDDTKVTFQITEQMTAYPGNVPCEIVITNSDSVIGSANFWLDVEEATLSVDTVISETELPILIKIPKYASDAEAWAVGKRFGEDVSPDDVAYHNNALYYASQAEANATISDTKAEEASLSAITAVAASNSAEQSAQRAEAQASNAASSASYAASSATGAGNSASQAVASASAASLSASQASSSATAAASSATDAASSATAAASSATAAASSATDAQSAAVTAAADAASAVEEDVATYAAAAANTAVSGALSGLTFGQDSNGKWGYKIGGADPVIPFSSGGGAYAFLLWRTNQTSADSRVPMFIGQDPSGDIHVSSIDGTITFLRAMTARVYMYTSSSRGTSGGSITATMRYTPQYGQYYYMSTAGNNSPIVWSTGAVDFMEGETVTITLNSSNTNTYVLGALFIVEEASS